MRAYIDSSAFLALLLREPHAVGVVELVNRATRLVSSNLLAAEVRSAIMREDATLDPTFDAIGWVIPERPLDDEMRVVLEAGSLTGADLWHVAVALSIAEDDPAELAFITLDERQREVAASLGFRTGV